MNISPIHTDADHTAALKEIDRLWNADPGTEDADKLDILVTLVERYEETRWPIEQPGWDPVDVLKYAINELGHSQSELAELLSSRPRASEILRRERPLSLDMIRAISEKWKIPPALLIKRYRSGRAAA
jgi:HTH-type transcriptional regulator/antitoxin HigA